MKVLNRYWHLATGLVLASVLWSATASADCTPVTIVADGTPDALATVALIRSGVDINLTQSQIDELFDGDLDTGFNVGRFIDFHQQLTLHAPDPDETFLITLFRITQSTECQPPDFPYSGSYVDIDGISQAISVTATYEGSPNWRSTFEFDIPVGGIELPDGGVLELVNNYLGCEPETSILEIEIEGELCDAAVGIDNWGSAQDQLAVLPCHPNPFHSSTAITFFLPRTQRMDLSVYTVGGRRIATLFSGVLASGTRSMTWMGRDDAGRSVSSGTYFYHLTTDEGTRVGKMLLVR